MCSHSYVKSPIMHIHMPLFTHLLRSPATQRPPSKQMTDTSAPVFMCVIVCACTCANLPYASYPPPSPWKSVAPLYMVKLFVSK